MVVEYHKVKRLLNAVCPELARVVVIAVVEEMNAEGIAANAFDLLAENGLRFIVAVAVGAVNLSAIKPMNILVGSSRLPQPLHKGLFGVNACEILDCDYRHLDSNINLFAEALAEGATLTKRVA